MRQGDGVTNVLRVLEVGTAARNKLLVQGHALHVFFR